MGALFICNTFIKVGRPLARAESFRVRIVSTCHVTIYSCLGQTGMKAVMAPRNNYFIISVNFGTQEYLQR